jgi:hypothetical protein
MSESDNAAANLRKQDNKEPAKDANIARFMQTVGVVAQELDSQVISGARPVAAATLPPIANLKVSGSIARTELRLAQSTSLLGNSSKAARLSLSRPAGVKAAQDVANALFGALPEPVRGGGAANGKVEPAARQDIQRLFPLYSEEQLIRGRAAVEADLRLHRAFDMDGRTVSVWEKLHARGLNQAQVHIILNAAAYLRENFASHRGPDGQIDADQLSNWLHTMDELDEVLESTRECSSAQIVRSAMSMFGDSVKTKRNFMVHNLDGTTAWKVVGERLSDSFSQQEVHGIGEANKEHQIGPPELMARIYCSNIIGMLNAQRTDVLSLLSTKTLADMSAEDRGDLLFLAVLKQSFDKRASEMSLLQSHDGSLSESDHARLDFLVTRQQDGPFVTDEESAAIQGIYHKLSNPFSVGLCDTPTGGKAIRFEEKEAELFRLTGNEFWYVPHESTYWYLQSRIGIDADSKANYARIGGFRKLLHLNGPETDTFFQFPTLETCLESPRCSYAQVWEIMTEEGKRQAETRLSETVDAVLRAKKATEKWLRAELKVAKDDEMSNVPFWSTELVYPERGNAEHEWWRIHKLSLNQRTPQEQLFWEKHRFDGLNQQQIQDYLLAIRIRDYMVDQLGREQRVDGLIPGDFKPVMSKPAV